MSQTSVLLPDPVASARKDTLVFMIESSSKGDYCMADISSRNAMEWTYAASFDR